MKLKLIFIVMDLLTVLAYPVFFVHGKLRQIPKSKDRTALANILAAGSVTPRI